MNVPARQASSIANNGKVIPSVSRSGHSTFLAWFMIVIGAVFLGFFLLGIMTQVQTNEAFVVGSGHVNSYAPNWAVFWQIPQLFFGGTSAVLAMQTIFGWGIELIFLAFTVGYEVVHRAAGYGSPMMGRLFGVISWAIVLFNIWCDANYGTILDNGVGGHIAFAVMTSIIVAFFGKIGLFFLEHGWAAA